MANAVSDVMHVQRITVDWVAARGASESDGAGGAATCIAKVHPVRSRRMLNFSATTRVRSGDSRNCSFWIVSANKHQQPSRSRVIARRFTDGQASVALTRLFDERKDVLK